MFGFQPPQFSKAEIAMMEAEANKTMTSFMVAVGTLYISPFVIDAVSAFF